MKEVRKAVLLFVALSILTGVVYPVAITFFAHFTFPKEASGSLIYKADGNPAGSALIGQPFSDPKYFWPRPSATQDFPYNALASGGSNLGPSNKVLIGKIRERIKSFKGEGLQRDLPADLVTSSGSGLDPHISADGALIQIHRVARARRMPEETIGVLVLKHIEGRQFGFLGAERVNVLKLNLALDALEKSRG